MHLSDRGHAFSATVNLYFGKINLLDYSWREEGELAFS